MHNTPIRVGVFSHLDAADDAVRRLTEAGFQEKHIAVICSDDDTHHERLEHYRQKKPGTVSGASALAGGAIGASLGGLAVVAGVATAGVSLLATGLAAMWAGGVAGGLIGAMSSRGVAKEYADYYDQAVAKGKVLVAVEYHGDDQQAKFAAAERAFEQAGAEPVELREG